MPRPRKCKRVCGMPLCSRFGPLDREPTGLVEMTVEEYETIRLMDLEGLSQEACAESMGVARTTAQRLYNDARAKLARCLVEGVALTIAGGITAFAMGRARPAPTDGAAAAAGAAMDAPAPRPGNGRKTKDDEDRSGRPGRPGGRPFWRV